MASDGAHLLHGRRLQILVDFLGVLAVLCVPCAHGLHLSALGIQAAVNVFEWFLHTVPVDHVLAVQRLANLVQVGQGNDGVFRTEVPVPAAGSHLAGQLVQVSKQMAGNGLIAHADAVRGHLHVAQYIGPTVREVQVVLQDAGALAAEDVLFGQSPQRKQAIACQHSSELVGRREQSGNLGRLGKARAGHPQKAAGAAPDVLFR